MEAWDIIVLGDSIAGLRAAGEAASKGANVLLINSGGLGSGDSSAIDGFAAHINEETNRDHRNDTIRNGAFLNNQDIVVEYTNQAIRQLDLMERWGFIWKRDSKGIPASLKLPGHNKPRVSSAGDANKREAQQIFEEQVMRHGVVRRGDQVPISLVHDDQRVNGLIVMDMITGNLISIQCKAMIIADDGAQNIFTDGSVGLGLGLAAEAGLPLSDLEFFSSSPLGVKDSDIILPLTMLADGAKLLESNGNEIEYDQSGGIIAVCNAISQAENPVIDARDLGSESTWWSSEFSRLKSRTGIDMQKQTVAVENRINLGIGGIAVDEHSRAVVGKWSRWFTGLYAAGQSANTGLHGAASLPGNSFLDSVVSGYSAGAHAADWVKNQPFGKVSSMNEMFTDIQDSIESQIEDTDGLVVRSGVISSKLNSIMNGVKESGWSTSSLESAAKDLASLKEKSTKLHLDNKSFVMNTNFLINQQLKTAVNLASMVVASANSRKESRGVFNRADFPEMDSELMHHSLVDINSNVDKLAIRKGSTGNWVLPPA